MSGLMIFDISILSHIACKRRINGKDARLAGGNKDSRKERVENVN